MEVTVTAIPDNENAYLKALSYSVDGGTVIQLKNFSPLAFTYNVVLPFGTDPTVAITMVPEAAVSVASIEIVNISLSYGTGTTTVKATSQDGSVTFTYSVSFKISTTPGSFQVGSSFYETLEEAVSAVPENGIIVMTQDVTLSSSVILSVSKTYTIDLGGYSLTNAGYLEYLLEIWDGFVTIQNGNALNTTGIAAIFVYSGGTLYILDGEYLGYDDAIYASGGTVVITSGHFVCTDDPAHDGCLTVYSGGSITLAPDSVPNITPWFNDPSATNVIITIGEAIDITDDFIDLNFRAEVYKLISKQAPEHIYNTDVAWVTELNVSRGNTQYSISDLSGIEHFKSLKYLNCSEQQLEELDVSENTALERLICFENQLRTLKVSNNTALTHLNCDDNQLTELDIPNNTVLITLNCGHNKITELPALPDSLINLICYVNRLTTLPELPDTMEMLFCGDNPLTALPSPLPSHLIDLRCWNDQLSVLPDIPIGLLHLDCSTNKLTSLPKLPNELKHLVFTSNNLTSFPELPDTLESLSCGNNPLTALPSPLPSHLTSLVCQNNQLSALPELPIGLWHLDCSGNQLTTLPVLSDFLGVLICSDNSLAALPSPLPRYLKWLFCAGNNLTSLPELPDTFNMLRCENNRLTKLDVSNNTMLFRLDCSYNNMESVDDVTGWREIGLVLDNNFTFYPQNEYVKYGDVEGDGLVTPFDATLVVQHIVGMIKLEERALKAADTDHDGTITPFDATLILQYIVGMVTSLD
jgi:hypothetical protein